MSSNQGDTTRRRLLESIGATGLAFGTIGVVTASEGDGDAAPATAKSDDVTTEGDWEYKCEDIPCCSGTGCQEYRRYCADGDCSGWERSGCCGGDCAPITC